MKGKRRAGRVGSIELLGRRDVNGCSPYFLVALRRLVLVKLYSTPDLMRAFSAVLLGLSPSKISIARTLALSSLALKSPCGSGRLAPAGIVSLPLSFKTLPMQTIPSCSQTGAPIGALGRRHFTASVISGSPS